MAQPERKKFPDRDPSTKVGAFRRTYAVTVVVSYGLKYSRYFRAYGAKMAQRRRTVLDHHVSQRTELFNLLPVAASRKRPPRAAWGRARGYSNKNHLEALYE
jgi:hypothetical protein